MNSLDMNTKPSLTEAADPVAVFMSSNCSRQPGSVAFAGLDRGLMARYIRPSEEAKESREDGSPRSHLSPRSSKVFVSKIHKTGECWEWMGRVFHSGYGRFHDQRAHRVAYEMFVGPIPDGCGLDHICRNRACVNPKHLEPVTSRENTLRGTNHVAFQALQTHCKRGHEFSKENTRVYRGRRSCKECCAIRESLYANGEVVNG